MPTDCQHPELVCCVKLKSGRGHSERICSDVEWKFSHVFPILKEIAALRPAAPVRRGDVLIADVLGTGADVIATRTILPPV